MSRFAPNLELLCESPAGLSGCGMGIVARMARCGGRDWHGYRSLLGFSRLARKPRNVKAWLRKIEIEVVLASAGPGGFLSATVLM
jgi:hypothetical protein